MSECLSVCLSVILATVLLETPVRIALPSRKGHRCAHYGEQQLSPSVCLAYDINDTIQQIKWYLCKYASKKQVTVKRNTYTCGVSKQWCIEYVQIQLTKTKVFHFKANWIIFWGT